MSDNKCISCKSNKVGKSKVMCDNCWDWAMERITINDIAIMVARLHHREPDNKHAKEICEYLVADNYSHGKSHLPKKQKLPDTTGVIKDG